MGLTHMRFATKSGLTILAIYFAVLGVVAVWMERELRSISDDVVSDTARLIGREVAAALTESTLQQVLNSDPDATANLQRIVRDVTARSQLVTSLLVVDASGTVLAGEGERAGSQVAMPQVIFGDDPGPRFIAEGGLSGRSLFLFVPLLQHGHIEGYLRLSLLNTRLSLVQSRARHQLLFAGGVGFVAVVVLSFLLHLQFNRVSSALTGALHAAIRGEAVAATEEGEFTEAFEAAQKVAKELSAARERGSQAQRRLSSLMQVMDVGVLLLNSKKELDFANQRARELLGGGDPAAWEQGWQAILPLLGPQLDACGELNSAGAQLDIDLPAEPRASSALRLDLYSLADENCEGYLVLIRSRDTIEALENELRLAIQMRGFARFYMAFAHDLKAPLNAMVMNLELLNRSLQNHEDGTDVERQQRYLSVLRTEITRLDRDLQTLLRQAAPPSTAAERFDLADLIRDLATLLGPQAKQQHVKLDTRLPDEPLQFSGHRDRLKQAFLNIAINALEAMPDGGNLALELHRSNGGVRVLITDSGPGIVPEVLKEIYRMHFTTKDGGTGIGLYVARSVVEAYGGRIDVQTAAGRGTRFEVALPLPSTPE
jgi:signal transduction histidine kinase